MGNFFAGCLAVVFLRSTFLRGVYGYVASSEEVNVLLHYVWHVSRMFSGYGFFFVIFFSPLFLPQVLGHCGRYEKLNI